MADKSQTRKNDTLGTIVLDYANGGATQAGRTFRLTPLEFRLLQVAAATPQSQPTVDDLQNLDWPKGFEKNSSVVESTIKQLRKKLDHQGKLIFPHLFATNPVSRPGSAQFPPFGQWHSHKAKRDPFIGTVFNGKYEILEPIGGGTSGLVYRGRHVGLDKSLAIKVLHLDAVTQSDLVRRFQREAKLTAQLSHTNIVGVRDFGLAEQGSPYLVMDLVDGVSLAELLLSDGRPPLANVIEIFGQACAGLDHAHNKGFIHRDIKPSNLMIAKAAAGIKQQVKIVDFGLARSAEENQGVSKITQTGVVVGSPHYMSPEQCQGVAVDRRTDVYSLGCALYETLTGHPPFTGPDAVATLVMHVTAAPAEIVVEGEAPLTQIRLNKVLKRCLTKDPDGRYQTAGELARDLEQVLTNVQSGDSISSGSSTRT